MKAARRGLHQHRTDVPFRVHFCRMNAHARVAMLIAMLPCLALSCTLGAALTPASTPTPGPTSTPLASPTPTLAVDLTPSTPVPTATADPDAPDSWACQIRWQVPNNGAKFGSKEHFDAAWQVTNNGYAAWDPDTVRFTYFSGRRMQISDSIKLKEVVLPDHRTQLLVPMVAPRAVGRYNTVWALWYGDRDFCHMSVTIVVK